jgi:DNA-binding IclR family transcriptional regulator
MRGLELIEEVARHGPITVTELSRRTGTHITIVSREVNALLPAGWLVKVDGKIVTGPRCAVVGMTSPIAATIREAEPLVGALAGVTGLQASATGLVGEELMTLTFAGGDELPDGLLSRMPVYVLAAGRAVAAQLSEDRLDALLPAEPYPDSREILAVLSETEALPTYLSALEPDAEPADTLPRDRKALDAALEGVREQGVARDHGEVHPSVHCIAVPWPTPALPAALTCFGDRAKIESSAPLIESCLRAAARPGAGPHEIATAAAKSPAA